jgi:hypothetical protein
VFESLVGSWYYQAAYLIGRSEVPGLSTRPAARCAMMRVFVFYIVISETNSSRYPFALSNICIYTKSLKSQDGRSVS